MCIAQSTYRTSAAVSKWNLAHYLYVRNGGCRLGTRPRSCISKSGVNADSEEICSKECTCIPPVDPWKVETIESRVFTQEIAGVSVLNMPWKTGVISGRFWRYTNAPPNITVPASNLGFCAFGRGQLNQIESNQTTSVLQS